MRKKQKAKTGGAIGSPKRGAGGASERREERLDADQKTTLPPPLAEQSVSAQEFADLIGLKDPRRVRELAAQGVIQRDGRGRYPIEGIRDYCDHLRETGAGDSEEDREFKMHRAALYAQRARKAKREADLIEGQSLSLPLAKELIEDVFSSCRAKLLALPTIAAPKLADVTDPRKVHEILEDEVRLALEELADPQRSVVNEALERFQLAHGQELKPTEEDGIL